MKIPKTLKIGATVYEVVRQSSDANGEKHLGYCNTGLAKIWIDSTAKQQVQESSLIHEILEAAKGGYCLELEHQTLGTLAEVLYQVLRDNGMLRED
jgi:hypothetical protein